ncbi:hypothetical protein MNBD_CHLOROFLEXI01-184 [hydrothermal vent metagenome]|uniref:Uncharacterized protein n=1 Tax=hydrothermal vent metagenome TaxID=652676 RepID=A0A3B0UKV7_9ZZZZ
MNAINEQNSLLNSAKDRLRRLSLRRLRVADDFLAYLEEREENEATEELLNIEGFEEAFAEAVQQAESGETAPWLATAGMLADDPTLLPMLDEIYTARDQE